MAGEARTGARSTGPTGTSGWRSIWRRPATRWTRCAPGGPAQPDRGGRAAAGRRPARAASAVPFRPRQPDPGAARGRGGRPRLLARGGPAARTLAAELGLTNRARFVEADLYDAPAAIPEPGSFDLVYVTWGAINWLPDIRRWAEIVAFFLKPGGALYLAEGHPAALVLDDLAPRGGADARLVRALLPSRRADLRQSRPTMPTRTRG